MVRACGTAATPPARWKPQKKEVDPSPPFALPRLAAAIMGYKPFQSTYYDAQMRASPALLRARAPYLIKNTITGTAIVATAIGIYAYTIHVISQDEFEDVIVPDKPTNRAEAQSVTARVNQASAARKHQES